MRSLHNADACLAMLKQVLPIIGRTGEAVLALALGHERLTIRQVALRLSHDGGNKAVYFWGETFRRSCEQLAEQWAEAGDTRYS